MDFLLKGCLLGDYIHVKAPSLSVLLGSRCLGRSLLFFTWMLAATHFKNFKHLLSTLVDVYMDVAARYAV